MNSADGLILVVNADASAADNLKELIEFMDAPHVCTATPGNWQQEIGDHRLEAVFVGPDVDENDIHAVVDDVGRLDPNIPIVMIGKSDST